MSNWIKFTNNNIEGFGTIDGSEVNVFEGDIFNNPRKTDTKFNLDDIVIKNPCQPTKMIALWNNYQSLANEKGLTKPNNPLYLNKAISCIIEQGEISSALKIMMKAYSLRENWALSLVKHVKGTC